MKKTSISPAKGYRKFNEDLWGSIILRGKLNRLTMLLISDKSRNKTGFFSLDITKKKSNRIIKRKSRYGFFLSERQKICAFYGGFTRKQYKSLCNKCYEKGAGNFSLNMCFMLESSLAFSLYRNSFFSNVNSAANFVKLGRVLVNKEVIDSPLFTVKAGDIIEIRSDYKEQVFLSVLARLKRKEVLYIGVPYTYVNFGNMSYSILKDKFNPEQVFYPFKFNYNFFGSEYRGKF